MNTDNAQIPKNKVIATIGDVYKQSENSKLKNKFFEKAEGNLEFLSKYFSTTKTQALFIAVGFVLVSDNDDININKLIKHFDCNPMKIFDYYDDFSNLVDTGILEKKINFRKQKYTKNEKFNNFFLNDYKINNQWTNAIVLNVPPPKIIKKCEMKSIYNVLEQLENLSEQRSDDNITAKELDENAENLINENKHLPVILLIQKNKLGIKESLIFLRLLWENLKEGGITFLSLADYLENIFDNKAQSVEYLQSIISGKNMLVKKELIKLEKRQFFNDISIVLTDKSINLIKKSGILLEESSNSSKNILIPDNIHHRELIFDESEMEQLFLLKKLLKVEKFNNIQKSLSDMNMPIGFPILLHGDPGTGKTEICKQIAKQTNRELIKVDISETKSCWFGESEKLIKKIFTDYKTLNEKSDSTPILLFNEADAIFSKRKEISSSLVSKTENAIQNILLEELENFEGILIATTNLLINLDDAFERRFLFKIKFTKPNTHIRSKIWKTKIPYLSQNDCNRLAKEYDFSGGQIDNIIRKNIMHKIIHGKDSNIENLLKFCSEETLGKNVTKIGFL